MQDTCSHNARQTASGIDSNHVHTVPYLRQMLRSEVLWRLLWVIDRILQGGSLQILTKLSRLQKDLRHSIAKPCLHFTPCSFDTDLSELIAAVEHNAEVRIAVSRLSTWHLLETYEVAEMAQNFASTAAVSHVIMMPASAFMETASASIHLPIQAHDWIQAACAC